MSEEKQEKFCKVCGCLLHTQEELETNWCTKHLDEFDRMCGW